MAGQLDVYRDWLRITETARPLNYYQLLRLEPFTDDTARIRAHYRKMNAHVRKFATGDYATESQELLNELARAMLCLTDVQRKREYDASLGRREEAKGRQRTLEEILLADKTISREQLAKARDYAQAVGLEIRDALVQQKMASPEAVMLAYAESVGLPYIELADVEVEEELIPRIPATLARHHSCVPVMTDEGELLMASPNPLIPDVEEELRLRFNMPVRTVLCTPSSINAMVAKLYPRDAGGPAPARAPKRPALRPAPRPAAPRPESPPLSQDEKTRRWLKFAVVAFNVTIIVCMIVLSILRGGMSFLGGWDFVGAVFLALLAGAVAFGIAAWQDL